MSQRGLQRWAPLAGPIFVALMVIGFVLAGSSPDPDSANSKIASYLADNSEYHRNAASFFVLLAATGFMITFFAVLRSRLVAAEGGLGRLGGLAFGAGIASAVFLFIGICLFISSVLAAHDAGSVALDPGIYRVTQDLGYMIFVGSVVVGSIAVWSTAAVALRTGLLPRWFAWVSVVVGVICLAAIVFIPIFVYWLWIVVTGILLIMRPAPLDAAAGGTSATVV
jgi:hypothetical protein